MNLGIEPGSGPSAALRGGGEPGTGRRSHRLAVALVAPAVLGCVLFLGGFGVFLGFLERQERDPPMVADGIVVLTGGQGRVEDALDLLAKGWAGRLLITGVNEKTSRESIKRLSPSLRDMVDCCVDLDYRARNTVDNATQIGRWARERGFRSLIVVTSYYHLPRTLAELDRELPHIRKIPHAVIGSRPDEPWDTFFARARVLMSEYVKFLAVSVRTRATAWLAADRKTARAPRATVAEGKRAG